MLTAIHHEIGLDDIYPGVSLNQGHWFAVTSDYEQYPCYYLPHSLIFDLGELPLIYHEIGHVVVRVCEGFLRSVETVITATVRRKELEILNEGDPKRRSELQNRLVQMPERLRSQLEELVCDILGCLLGGPAYAIAFHVGLWTAGTNPFELDTSRSQYTPRDYRMRACQIALLSQELAPAIVNTLNKSWSELRNSYREQAPAWYFWDYDDRYLEDVITSVVSQLEANKLTVYNPSVTGIRNMLNTGLELMLVDESAYQDWLEQTNKEFRARFT